MRRRFDDALPGLVMELDGGAVIAVNDLQSEERQRFTIGHELGHHVLAHHEVFHIDLGASAEDGTPPGYGWCHERSANDFAAELLMPAVVVHEALSVTASVAHLADRFGVSQLAMGYRLANLGFRQHVQLSPNSGVGSVTTHASPVLSPLRAGVCSSVCVLGMAYAPALGRARPGLRPAWLLQTHCGRAKRPLFKPT